MNSKSHPKTIAAASKNNCSMPLTNALADNNNDHYQVGGISLVTKEVHQAFTTGHGVCLITFKWNGGSGIIVKDFHKHNFPPNFHWILKVEFAFMDWFHCSPLPKHWIDGQRHLFGWVVFMHLLRWLLM